MRWWQQCRGPWWLEMVEGGLWRGHSGLGLGKQNTWLRGSQQEPCPARQPLAQKLLGQDLVWSFAWGILAEAHPWKTHRGAGGPGAFGGAPLTPFDQANVPPTR